MHTLEAIFNRKSTRNYKQEQLPENVLQVILKAGFAAPVAMANYGSLHITVVQNQDFLDKVNAVTEEALYKITGEREKHDMGAKTLILISSTPVHRPGTEYTNVGIVMENMVLAATDLGVDSVILGAAPAAVAQDAALVRALGIPDGYKPMLGVFFGYGAEETLVSKHEITVNRV